MLNRWELCESSERGGEGTVSECVTQKQREEKRIREKARKMERRGEGLERTI